VLAALPEIIRDGVLATGKVRIHDLGTFTLRQRAARQGRNPHTGEAVAIPPKKFVKFVPASAFKERLKHLGNPTR
jgi:nucleoid DNA-binding protein